MERFLTARARFEKRLKPGKQPKSRHTAGVLAKCAHLVNRAHLGAMTDANL